ncbi:hypothetical protein [Gordonia phthalatica]|uniref:Uncharacterized protein n=1 Tax=Gordonia phthalatica TaxID=1136941 RepID=A0A0N9NG49_9ACTN|nr:hypothetical protein [Gordonia phthalatica]ALG86077.1 hypothetical protein ACH46_18195 [Gordonia phthalatica]
MTAPHVTFVFAGVRYPITAETGDRIMEFVADTAENFLGARPFVIPTVDGRQVIANLGPTMPYAIEIGVPAVAADDEAPVEDQVRMLVAERDFAPDVRL